MQKTSFNYTPISYITTVPAKQLPVEIQVKSIHLNLPIIESRIVKSEWQVNGSGASHLVSSGKPGKKNNIVIYGHNFSGLFGPIREIKNDDIITVKTAEGKVYTYKTVQILTVDPSQIHLVMPTDKEVLTLFTCDGWADSQRFVVKAVSLKLVL